MEDGGQTLRELIVAERDMRPWSDVLPLYASVQIDLIGDVPELLALGVPDRLVEQAPRAEQLEAFGLSAGGIARRLRALHSEESVEAR